MAVQFQTRSTVSRVQRRFDRSIIRHSRASSPAEMLQQAKIDLELMTARVRTNLELAAKKAKLTVVGKVEIAQFPTIEREMGWNGSSIQRILEAADAALQVVERDIGGSRPIVPGAAMAERLLAPCNAAFRALWPLNSHLSRYLQGS